MHSVKVYSIFKGWLTAGLANLRKNLLNLNIVPDLLEKYEAKSNYFVGLLQYQFANLC